MNTQTLKNIAKLKQLSDAELARMGKVSRQAVSKWWSQDHFDSIEVKNSTLANLAQGLKVSMDILCTPLPLHKDQTALRQMETQLLWDHLYPSLILFVDALLRNQKQAMARLVQVYGLFGAKKIIGISAWSDFPHYKEHIIPVRKKGLEKLWQKFHQQILN